MAIRPWGWRTWSDDVFDDGSPIYRQIAERIERDVVDGVLEPDEKLMSTNEYAAFYRINPATAAKAFHELVDRGVLYKRRGIGMFVSPQAREQLRTDRRRRFFDEVVDPMIAEARSIDIALDDVVAHVQRAAERTPSEVER